MARSTFRLRTWTRYLAPLEEVWAWKVQLPNIQGELLPHRFSIEAGEALARALAGEAPIQLSARLSLWGVGPGVKWPIHLTEAVPNERFTDQSKNRLYEAFSHTHLIERTPDGCRYVDDVVFTPAIPAQKLAAILTQRAFIQRHRFAARAFPTDPQATAVSVLRLEQPGGS